MDRPTCKTCPYFTCIKCLEFPSEDTWCCLEDGRRTHDETICTRFPPSQMYLENGFDPPKYIFMQPEVDKNDSCGEHPDFPEYIKSLKASHVGT